MKIHNWLQKILHKIKITIRFRSVFLSNVLWSTIGYGFRIVFQALYLIILARTLGPADFGLFSGILGLVTVLAPFAGWGSGLILIKNVSRNTDKFPFYWGTALSVTIVSSLILTLFTYALGTYIFSFYIAQKIILPVAIGDYFGMRLAEVSGQAFQAHERLSKTSLIWFFLSFYRLISVFVLSFISSKSIETWALLYMISSSLAGLSGVIWVFRIWRRTTLGFLGMKGEWKNGFYFSVSVAALGTYNDIDKTLLSKISGNDIAGMYAAAYRVIDAIYIPVRAIIMASFPRFFQEGSLGLKHSWGYAKRLIPWSLLVAIMTWCMMIFIAPFISFVLGDEYNLTSKISMWLGPILIFRSIHNLLANVLTGADYQGVRSLIQVIIALVNVILNLWLIPIYSWVGAIISSLLSDGLLVVLLFLAIRIGMRKHELAIS